MRTNNWWRGKQSAQLEKTLLAVMLVGGGLVQGQAQDAAVDVQEGLVAHWPFNEQDGLIASDASGNGHDGALVGYPEPGFTPWVTGLEGGALSFANDGYVEVTGLPELESTTWAAWVKQSEITSFQSVITADFEDAGAGHILDLAGGETESNPRVVWNHGVERADLESPDAVPLGEWAHVALTLDAPAGELSLYVDGELKDSTTEVTTSPFSTVNLGRRAASGGSLLVGLMDDARVYNRALSGTEILALSGDDSVDPGSVDLEAGLVAHWQLDEQSGRTAADATGNGHDGELLGFPDPSFTPWVAGREDGALVFNGDGYVEVTGLPALESTTWVAWVQQTEITSFQSVVTATFEGAGAGHILDLAGGDAGSNPRVVWNHGVERADLESPDVVPVGEWMHVAMTLDAGSGELSLYVNGELKDSIDSATTTAYSTINLGRRVASGGSMLIGLLDDVRIYDRALSVAEVNALIGQRVTGPPQITQQPESQSVYPGTTVTFEVQADGLLPLQYQWLKDGETLRGETGRILTLTRIHEEDAGEYQVRITNDEGEIESDVATLTAEPIEFLTTAQVALWKFDETTGLMATDSSGNGNDADLVEFADSESHWVEGQVGGALQFSGQPNRIVVPETGDLTFPDGATFTFWVKPDTYGTENDAPNADFTFRHGRVLRKGTDVDISLADDPGGPTQTLLVGGGGGFDAADRAGFRDAGVTSPANSVELGVWQHFAVVFQGGQVTFFKDGFPISEPQPMTLGGENTENIILGNFNDGVDVPRFYEGTMDEVGIWSRPLTDNEILTLAGRDAEGAPQIVQQPESKTRLVGNPAVFSVVAEGKRPISYQWLLDGEPIGGETGSSLALPELTLENAGVYTVKISNSEGEVLSDSAELIVNPIEDVTAGLIAYWPFDEAQDGTAVDGSGNGHDGQLQNFAPMPVVDGQIDGAFDFDGTDDFIIVPHDDQLNLTDQATIAAWINPRSFGQPLDNHGRILRKASNYDFRIVSAQPYFVDPGLSGPIVELDIWQHYAVVIKDGTVEFFKNGQSLGEPVPGSVGELNTSDLVIGNFQPDLEIPRLFDGWMDDVGIWNRALNQQEISGMYQNGALGKPLVEEFEPLTIRSLNPGTTAEQLSIVFFSPYADREFALERKPDLAAEDWMTQDEASFTELGQGEYEAAVPMPAEDMNIYRIRALAPAAIFETDFESGAGEWTHGGQNDSWALGTPTSGPDSAFSGENVFATNLDGDFTPDTDAYLRSPVIDLTDVTRATLQFYEFRNIDPNPSFHRAMVNVLDAGNETVIAELARDAGQTDGWEARNLPLGSNVLGRPVIFEFRLVTDPFNPLPGWYIDDVKVLPE